MLEVLADPLGLALHTAQMARCGSDQVQFGSGRGARGHTLLDVGVGHLVGIEFGAIAGQVEHLDRIGVVGQGDMSNFRLLTSKEIAELDSDYMTKSHVVWRAEGLVGTLRILPNKKITLGEVNAAIIGDDARACKGKFASGSVADDKSRSVLRLFTACEEDGEAFEYRYTVVPVGDGTHYLFSTIGRADGGERAGRVAKVESALRQAVYEVMKQ